MPKRTAHASDVDEETAALTALNESVSLRCKRMMASCTSAAEAVRREGSARLQRLPVKLRAMSLGGLMRENGLTHPAVLFEHWRSLRPELHDVLHDLRGILMPASVAPHPPAAPQQPEQQQEAGAAGSTGNESTDKARPAPTAAMPIAGTTSSVLPPARAAARKRTAAHQAAASDSGAVVSDALRPGPPAAAAQSDAEMASSMPAPPPPPAVPTQAASRKRAAAQKAVATAADLACLEVAVPLAGPPSSHVATAALSTPVVHATTTAGGAAAGGASGVGGGGINGTGFIRRVAETPSDGAAQAGSFTLQRRTEVREGRSTRRGAAPTQNDTIVLTSADGQEFVCPVAGNSVTLTLEALNKLVAATVT